MTSTGVPPHPAKWSESVLEALRLLGLRGPVLDPFAGVGIARLADALGLDCFGLEIEPDWAKADPRIQVGDALDPPFLPGTFRSIVTSSTYGNRMADAHDAKERCRACRGHGETGVLEGGVWFCTGDPCPKCDGLGHRVYKRLTYRHQIGHPLHPNNSGAMPWGPRYQEFHQKAWAALLPLLADDRDVRFVLNVKDHWRTLKKGEDPVRQEVTRWHAETLDALGWVEVVAIQVPVPSMKFGANRDTREEFESILVFARAA